MTTTSFKHKPPHRPKTSQNSDFTGLSYLSAKRLAKPFTERETQVADLRENHSMTFPDIAKRIGLSQSRVRQLYTKVKRKRLHPAFRLTKDNPPK
jgi:DNA-directed RNA polymerase specialized sigma subunit